MSGRISGLYSLAAATLHPGAVKVLAVEPHPLNLLTLLRQLALNGQQHAIELVCAAAGAAPGLGKLWPYSTMGNFIAEDRPADAPDDNPPLTVPIIPLDMLFAERPELADGRVFLKIDVEGFEPAVIAGAEHLLGTGRLAAVVLEKSDYYADPARRPAFEAMVATLHRHGYTIHWFPHAHLPCALIPWVDGNETGNLVALAPGFAAKQAAYDGPYAPYTPLPPPMTTNFSASDQAALTRRLIENRGTDGWRWANPRNLETGSEERAALAQPHVPAKCRLLDLGAGLMHVAMKVRTAGYTPVDLIRYAKATYVTDLNSGGFPDGAWDCALALELLEHIHDVPALLARIRASCKRLICTYKSTEDVGDATLRRQQGYFNDFDRAALQSMLQAAGWRVTSAEVRGDHSLFVCD